MRIIESTTEAYSLIIPICISPLLLWFAVFATAAWLVDWPLMPFIGVIAWSWCMHMGRILRGF